METGTQKATEALDHLLYILSALGEMAEQMTSNPNPTSSIKAILRMAKGAFGIGKGALFLFCPEDESLEMVAEGLEERSLTLELPMPTRRYLLAEGGAPITDLPDAVEHHPALAEFVEANAEALGSLPTTIWLPLSVNRHFVGLLMLGEKLSRDPLSRTEMDTLTLIGRQLAVALHNFRLNHELKGANLQLGLKVRQLEQLFDITRDISSTLDRNRITRELVIRTIELLDARKGMLLLLDEAGTQLEAAAWFGFESFESSPTWSAHESWIAPVVLAHEPVLISEGLPAHLRARHCVAVPVAYQDRLLGVLAVFDKESRDGVETFTEDDVPLIVSLANQAATSIENARLYELATVDGLTKLYIRRHFEQRLHEELRRAERYGTVLSLMMMDIDHFKKFNDTYGHQTGDEVIKLVARTIKQSVREEDIAARYGGEEMLVLMPETDVEGAHRMAERVREAILDVDLPGPNGETLHVAVSVGVATWPLHAHDAESLIEVADKALYQSKQAGRNRTTIWQPPTD
jgi:diguanylate cyclase (GGDEF)-like protein